MSELVKNVTLMGDCLVLPLISHFWRLSVGVAQTVKEMKTEIMNLIASWAPEI